MWQRGDSRPEIYAGWFATTSSNPDDPATVYLKTSSCLDLLVLPPSRKSRDDDGTYDPPPPTHKRGHPIGLPGGLVNHQLANTKVVSSENDFLEEQRT